jgi:hypothetical protein
VQREDDDKADPPAAGGHAEPDAPAIPMLDYAPRRRRVPFAWGAVPPATVVLIFLNVLPHFRTTGPEWSRGMEPEYGWPWICYWSAPPNSVAGPFFSPAHLCLDLVIAVGIIAVYGIWRTYRAGRA